MIVEIADWSKYLKISDFNYASIAEGRSIYYSNHVIVCPRLFIKDYISIEFHLKGSPVDKIGEGSLLIISLMWCMNISESVNRIRMRVM